MKAHYKSSKPVLQYGKLDFFYSILTLWESDDEPKVVKNFSSSEIKQFLACSKRGHKILSVTTDKNKICDSIYEIYVNKTKDTIGLSLLYHLRNAFAHNDIQLVDNKIIIIHHEWQGITRLKTRIPFDILKGLIETMRGKHNLSPEDRDKDKKEKKKPKKKGKK